MRTVSETKTRPGAPKVAKWVVVVCGLAAAAAGLTAWSVGGSFDPGGTPAAGFQAEDRFRRAVSDEVMERLGELWKGDEELVRTYADRVWRRSLETGREGAKKLAEELHSWFGVPLVYRWVMRKQEAWLRDRWSDLVARPLERIWEEEALGLARSLLASRTEFLAEVPADVPLEVRQGMERALAGAGALLRGLEPDWGALNRMSGGAVAGEAGAALAGYAAGYAAERLLADVLKIAGPVGFVVGVLTDAGVSWLVEAKSAERCVEILEQALRRQLMEAVYVDESDGLVARWNEAIRKGQTAEGREVQAYLDRWVRGGEM